jgi:hypothetical protein
MGRHPGADGGEVEMVRISVTKAKAKQIRKEQFVNQVLLFINAEIRLLEAKKRRLMGKLESEKREVIP